MRTRLRKLVGLASIFGLIGVAPPLMASAVTDPGDTVFFSEVHYDNVGADTGEAIEIFGPTCTDLSGWSIEFYNGSATQLNVYGTESLSGFIPDLGGGFGVVSVDHAGIQNGAPDGFALIDDAGTVRQFFSYEGTFVPTSGTAAGMTPTELPVSESSSTAAGTSLQLEGSGDTYGDFTWATGTDHFGSFGANLTPSGVGGDPSSCAVPDVRFNELHYDNDGADANEAIEVIAPAGTDLAGWSIVLYNGSNGTSYNTTSLSSVVADQGGGSGVVSVSIAGIQNGGPDGMALVDAGGGVVEFLSYEGSFTAIDGPAAGILSSDIAVAEGSSTLADQSLQRDGSGAWDGPFCNSFGDLNEASPDVLCPTPPAEVKIHEVQGSGSASPLLGQRVIIEGVVVGDQEGPAPALRGFFVQEEDIDQDSDPLTSEGLFVFNFNFDNVNVGDLVQVEGTVSEFGGNTQLGTFVEITPLGTAPLPTATVIEFPIDTANTLEEYEGMLATFPQTLVISEYFNYDRFGDVVVALPAPGEDRPYNPTSVFGPNTQDALDRQDLNQRSRITIDDGLTWQNVDTPVHPINRQLFSQANSFRGGDQVAGLTGPLYEGFGGHRILPLVDNGYDSYVQTEQPASPDDVGGDLTVATMNALNYFVTIDDGSNNCGPNNDQNCRGADSQFELDRQRVKLLNALEGLDADVIGMVEVENTIGVEALADLAGGLNDRLGAGTYDYIAAGTDSVVGPDAIKVGILYRPDAVAPIGDAAVLDTQAFINPNDYATNKNRAAVASSFVNKANGGVFSVVVNHLKSKGSSCGTGDDHPLAGSCNDTRTKAAQELANWLDTNPTGVDDSDWLIIGDLNSYDKETPISVLTGEGYTDLIAQYVGEFAYSYVFSGEFGYLDYVMSSESMTSQVSGATEWHINADEPDIFDYDTRFQSNYAISLFDPTTPFRASDHDVALLGLDLDGPDAEVVLGAALDEVAALLDGGALNKGQATSLTKSLNQALRQIERGQTNGASGILTGVLSQLDDFVADGILTPEQAHTIACYAGAVLAGL